MKKRNGALIALIDIFTMGLFLLFYMIPLQKEIEEITKKKRTPYYLIYLLGLVTLLIAPIVWISLVANDLNKKAKELHIEGKLTSFNEMFFCNFFGMIFVVPSMIATYRFFDTLYKIESVDYTRQ